MGKYGRSGLFTCILFLLYSAITRGDFSTVATSNLVCWLS